MLKIDIVHLWWYVVFHYFHSAPARAKHVTKKPITHKEQLVLAQRPLATCEVNMPSLCELLL